MGSGKQPGVGPAGRNLAANAGKLLEARGMSQRRLSAELERAGCPIQPLGVARMLKGERRVDVDEAVALAAVFSVPLGVLLSPAGADGNDARPAFCEASNLIMGIEELLAADDAETRTIRAGCVGRSARRLQIEVEAAVRDYLSAHSLLEWITK